MRRRVVVGAGVAAAAAGIGVAVWRNRAAPPADIWTLRFVRPGGGALALADFRGKPLLLNFWATWCVPCVTEMPLLSRFYENHRAAGWQVVGLAVDREDAVREFLAQRATSFPVALAGLQGLDLSKALGNSAGGLPFSVAFDTAGRPKTRKLGAVDAPTLANWAAAIV